MEIVREKQQASKVQVPERRPTNDNRHKVLSTGRSIFPDNAVARIFKPSRSAMTSGKAGMKGWQLVFERRSAPFIEPLMGYTGGNDTLAQVALKFPTLAAAFSYAERQGLTYVVQKPKDHKVDSTVDRRVPVTLSPTPRWSGSVSARRACSGVITPSSCMRPST